MVEQSKEERVHHVFEKIYDKYDAMNSVISFKRHVAWRKDVMKRMNVSTGASALDVCTGTGDWAISLAEATGPAGNVVGLDFSENMLKVAQETKELDKLSHLEFVHGSAMGRSFGDVALVLLTIRVGPSDVPDYLQVLKEIHRLGKPGGTVVCSEPSQPPLTGFRRGYSSYFRFMLPRFGKPFVQSDH